MKTALKGVTLLLLVLAATACGVKSDLVTPDGHATPHGQKDPAKPTSTIGQ